MKDEPVLGAGLDVKSTIGLGIQKLIKFAMAGSVHLNYLILFDIFLHLCLAGLYLGYIHASDNKNNMIYNWIHTNRIRIRTLETKLETKRPSDDNNTPMNAENIGIYKDYKSRTRWIYGFIGSTYILIAILIYKEYKHARHTWFEFFDNTYRHELAGVINEKNVGLKAII